MNSQIDDLLFTPLDLPPPPEIDLKLFNEWHYEQLEFNKKHNPMDRLSNGKDPYPWKVSWAVWWNTYKLDDPWICDFDKKFPELVDYLNLFPIKQFKSISFLDQKESREVYLHGDRDDWFGLRFYLHNTLGEKLYLVRTKEKGHKRQNLYDEYNKFVDLWPYTDGKKEYPKFPEKRCAFMLNSVRSLHGVDYNDAPLVEGSSRITAVVQGEYDYVRLHKLVKQSVEKYKDYTIWY